MTSLPAGHRRKGYRGKVSDWLEPPSCRGWWCGWCSTQGAFGNAQSPLMLLFSRPEGFPGKQWGRRGRDSRAFFWGGGTGSEVLSTQEMRSKEPQTSLQTQGGEAGFSFGRTVGPGVGKQGSGQWEAGKEAPLAPSGREGASLPWTQKNSRAEDSPTLRKQREQNH